MALGADVLAASQLARTRLGRRRVCLPPNARESESAVSEVEQGITPGGNENRELINNNTLTHTHSLTHTHTCADLVCISESGSYQDKLLANIHLRE